MSNVPILDASAATRKIDVFQRTEGADTVETQAVAIVDPANGNPLRPDGAGQMPVAPNITRGSGVVDANTTRVTLATDGPGVQNLTAIAAGIGAPADAAATTDAGTFSVLAFIKRGLANWTALLARIPTLVSGRIPTDGSGVTQPVSGTFWQATQPVSGAVSVSNMVAQGLTDAQLRATALPVSGTFWPTTQPVSASANLPTSNNATIFQFSTNNTSTAQLTAGATFTGVIETALDQPAISLLLTSDQPITITVKQFIDVGGTRAVPDIVFYVAAGAGFARSFTLNGNYVQVLATNTGASSTTTFSLNTAYGDLGDSDSSGIMPVTELPLVLTGAAAQTAVVNNILTPTSGAAGLNVSGYRTASVQVVCTATGGTFIFEQSNDGTNWRPLPVFNAELITGVAITAAITASSSQIMYTFPLRGNFVRLRIATLLTGGSAQAFTRIGTDPWTPTVNLVAQPSGANFSATATLANNANLVGDVGIQFRATTPGTTLANVLTAATNNLTQLKASAGKVAGGFLTNTTASLQYVKLFALPSASVTMGTTSATTQIALQPNQTVNLAQGDFGTFLGGTGVTYAVTTGSALNDNTATTAGAVVGYVLWI